MEEIMIKEETYLKRESENINCVKNIKVHDYDPIVNP